MALHMGFLGVKWGPFVILPHFTTGFWAQWGDFTLFRRLINQVTGVITITYNLQLTTHNLKPNSYP